MLQTGCCLEDRYILGSVIGRGGTSTVYEAFDQRIQRKRAIKVIEKSSDTHREFWKKERIFLQKLHHPHLVEFYDVLEAEDQICLVMEYLDGLTLKDVLKNGKIFTAEEVLRYGKQLCEVLGYLHGQKPPVIYRDLKPSNLMLTKTERLVLIDFGSAREYQKEKGQDTEVWTTVGYGAPELLEGRNQSNGRVDIYSMGVILYEMYTGKRFARKNLEHPDRGLEHIIERCTRRDPEKRYASVREVLYDLQHVQEIGWKNQQKKRGRRVVLCLAASAALWISGQNFRAQAERILREGYTEYMENGAKETESDRRIRNFQAAVLLNPWKEEAYEALVTEYRERGFRQRDYEELMEFLETETRQGRSPEACLKERKENYGRFAFAMGVACFFEWEGYGNKKYAIPWLRLAADNSSLEPEQREQAEGLWKIASYQEEMKRAGPAGNLQVFWEYLWEEARMKAISGFEKLIPEEVRTQVIRYAADFSEAGITRKEMERLLHYVGAESQEEKKLMDFLYTDLPEEREGGAWNFNSTRNE